MRTPSNITHHDRRTIHNTETKRTTSSLPKCTDFNFKFHKNNYEGRPNVPNRLLERSYGASPQSPIQTPTLKMKSLFPSTMKRHQQENLKDHLTGHVMVRAVERLWVHEYRSQSGVWKSRVQLKRTVHYELCIAFDSVHKLWSYTWLWFHECVLKSLRVASLVRIFLRRKETARMRRGLAD